MPTMFSLGESHKSKARARDSKITLQYKMYGIGFDAEPNETAPKMEAINSNEKTNWLQLRNVS